MLKKVLSVVVGFVVWSLLWLATGAIFKTIGVVREDGTTDSSILLVVFILLSVVISIVSGYVTGVVARANEVKHAFHLGIVLLIVGLIVQISSWTMAPIWYHLVFLILLAPATVYGGFRRGGSGARRRPARAQGV